MTKSEWINIGISNNLIDPEQFEEVNFFEAYKKWICMKIKMLKCQSIDRIECTWYRYYDSSELSKMTVSSITDRNIIDFLFAIKTSHPDISYKEFGRIMQIICGVLNYMHDMNMGGAPLHDWNKIKRLVQVDKIPTKHDFEYAIPEKDIKKLLDNVINQNIYPGKRSASLLLCMNFFLGLRIGELAALSWTDFDFERNIVHINKTESKFYERSEDGEKEGTMVYKVVEDCKTIYSVRTIPILPEVKEIYDLLLQHHQEHNYDSDYLCYDGNNTIMVRSLDRTLRKLCALCSIKYFNSHAIRKTFATTLHNHNVPTRVISDILGHSEIGTTENCYILSYRDNYDKYLGYMRKSLSYELKKSLPDSKENIKESARRGSNPRPQ